MAEHEDVDPAVPWRQALVEREEEPARIRAAVDHEPASAAAFDEDPVALPDVKDDDPSKPIGSMDEHDPEADCRQGQRSRRELCCSPGSRRP